MSGWIAADALDKDGIAQPRAQTRHAHENLVAA